MYGNNTKRLGTCFKKVGGQRGGYQFMATTCSAFVHAETNTSLCSASSNPNSFDGNFFMRSREVELEVVTNFQDDVSCGQDVMSKCSCTSIIDAML